MWHNSLAIPGLIRTSSCSCGLECRIGNRDIYDTLVSGYLLGGEGEDPI